jgi:hypothetical protein
VCLSKVIPACGTLTMDGRKSFLGLGARIESLTAGGGQRTWPVLLPEDGIELRTPSCLLQVSTLRADAWHHLFLDRKVAALLTSQR